MPGIEQYVGQVLDDKYSLERLLGKGGMGAVYLATHLGTDRYVALKLISPQFMRNTEFVERFKREARAAGRLRHPNVVDVTDFGFARVKEGQVAYLVMEYLDGCTLGDVLAEEKSLPLEWVADILEQVCSAVHEAHNQGIIHRDLKPDNIWLEPNRLGGYRVKVLDFGIAKLGPTADAPSEEVPATSTIIDNVSAVHAAADLEVNTLLGSPQLTKAHSYSDSLIEEDGTLLFDDTNGPSAHHTTHSTSASGAALTRVGAIMGTPLYMSPEQCAGGQIDMRSDIYSLGVIAYQMLAGEPPFSGNTSAVMRAHKEESPQHLRERAAKIPKRVAGVVMSALAKDPAQRPPTAFAFGSALRGQAEGVGALYRRAFALYSEYFPKFLKLSLIAHVPVFVTTALMIALIIVDHYVQLHGMVQKALFYSTMGTVALAYVVGTMITAAVISGVTAVMITQISAAPLRPVKLRVAFGVLKKRWRPFVRTLLRVTLRMFLGYLLFIVPGIVVWIRYSLYGPVVLIEGLSGKDAMQRARALAARSWRTMIIVSVVQILIPIVVSALLSVLLFSKGARGHWTNEIFQQVFKLANIFIMPLISIVPALLYVKMRQLSGEPLTAALAQIEESEGVRSAWQQRMRTRLSLHTPTTNKTTGS